MGRPKGNNGFVAVSKAMMKVLTGLWVVMTMREAVRGRKEV